MNQDGLAGSWRYSAAESRRTAHANVTAFNKTIV